MTAREGALFVLTQDSDKSWLTLLNQFGHMPLPPYIDRADDDEDLERYQTVYAQNPGAVAAPTAGLHFDQALIAALKNKGVEAAHITLHVGAGTFQPVKVDKIEEHVMHTEWVHVTQSVSDAIFQANSRGNKVRDNGKIYFLQKKFNFWKKIYVASGRYNYFYFQEKQLNSEIVKIALKLGGTCTAEHGIGYRKKKYSSKELGQSTVDFMQFLKKQIDPLNLFNPEKVVHIDSTLQSKI